MNKAEFLQMIANTDFDDNLKRLFVTGYELGYTQGQIDQMTKAINLIDTIEAESTI